VGVEMAAGVVAEAQADDSVVLIGGNVEVEVRRRQRRPSRWRCVMIAPVVVGSDRGAVS